jgi:hypothetical protein
MHLEKDLAVAGTGGRGELTALFPTPPPARSFARPEIAGEPQAWPTTGQLTPPILRFQIRRNVLRRWVLKTTPF